MIRSKPLCLFLCPIEWQVIDMFVRSVSPKLTGPQAAIRALLIAVVFLPLGGLFSSSAMTSVRPRNLFAQFHAMVEISAAQVGVGILFQSFPPLAMFGHCATHPAFKYFYTSNLCFPSFSGGAVAAEVEACYLQLAISSIPFQIGRKRAAAV